MNTQYCIIYLETLAKFENNVTHDEIGYANRIHSSYDLYFSKLVSQ